MSHKSKLISASAVILCASLSSAAFAASAPTHVGMYKGVFALTPMVSGFAFSSKRRLTNGGGLGFGLSYNFDNNWTAEFRASAFTAKQKRAPKKSVDGQFYTLDGMYYFRSGKAFQPFVNAGFGLMHRTRPENNNPSTQANINAGVGAAYFIDHSIALRASVDDYYNTSVGGVDTGVHLGVMFLIGDDHSSSSDDATEQPVDMSETAGAVHSSQYQAVDMNAPAPSKKAVTASADTHKPVDMSAPAQKTTLEKHIDQMKHEAASASKSKVKSTSPSEAQVQANESLYD